MPRDNKNGEELLLEFTVEGIKYLYAGATDHDAGFDRDMKEITDMETPAEAREYMGGRIGHTLDVNALHKPGTDEAEGQKHLDYYTALELFKAGTLITVNRGGKEQGEKYITATYLIKSVKKSAKDGEPVTESLSLQGTGDFDICTVA